MVGIGRVVVVGLVLGVGVGIVVGVGSEVGPGGERRRLDTRVGGARRTGMCKIHFSLFFSVFIRDEATLLDTGPITGCCYDHCGKASSNLMFSLSHPH